MNEAGTGVDQTLAGRVAVVAGATRGAGRGIARMLGAAGATVYCTGRGSRSAPSTAGPHAGRPESIEETAAQVDAAGGRGIPGRGDHAVPDEGAGLGDRIRREAGRLDVLVLVLGGTEVDDRRPMWKLPLDAGRALLDAWIWPPLVTTRHLLPLMVERRGGLVADVLEGETLDYRGQLYFDLAVTVRKRLAYALAEELAPRGVTALAIAPGFMRTEAILTQFGATEETWPTVARENADARGYGFAGSETPCFVGRAVAALAADPQVASKTGGLFCSWELAEEYGFTDVDGARPHWGRYLAEHFPALAGARPRSGRRWAVVEA
jgi:NAD(P)-dependent dehydrogenase (short-subunit alcohol dehydrogenase family)